MDDLPSFVELTPVLCLIESQLKFVTASMKKKINQFFENSAHLELCGLFESSRLLAKRLNHAMTSFSDACDSDPASHNVSTDASTVIHHEMPPIFNPVRNHATTAMIMQAPYLQ